MDNAATVAAWAAVFAAIVGPILGVLMANIFARYEFKRTEASKLFRTIIEHTSLLQAAFSNYVDVDDELGYSLAMNQSAREAAMSSPPEGSNSKDYDHRDLVKATLQLRAMQSALKADSFSIRCLFGPGTKCGQLIGSIVDDVDTVLWNECAPSDVGIYDSLAEIPATLLPLYESLRISDPLRAEDF